MPILTIHWEEHRNSLTRHISPELTLDESLLAAVICCLPENNNGIPAKGRHPIQLKMIRSLTLALSKSATVETDVSSPPFGCQITPFPLTIHFGTGFVSLRKDSTALPDS